MPDKTPSFIKGVRAFQNNAFCAHADLFTQLSSGQKPEALFITCADSRIDPCLITQTKPGVLFHSRNAGNLVPPGDTGTPCATASAIEYAMLHLKIPHIVICGHSNCGAMQGALMAATQPGALDAMPQVSSWLIHARAAVNEVVRRADNETSTKKLNLLLEQNVILQLQHLQTHKSVATRLQSGAVILHGWIYDIKSGAITVHDPSRDQFIPFAERYRSKDLD